MGTNFYWDTEREDRYDDSEHIGKRSVVLDEDEATFRKLASQFAYYDPYTCLMAAANARGFAPALQRIEEAVRERGRAEWNRWAKAHRTYDPSTVTVTIDGVELTDVLEVSYGRTKFRKAKGKR